jgi:hypothetical protein
MTQRMWVWMVAVPWLLGACAPALNWREVRPEGSGLRVMFPCKPKPETRQVPLAGAPVPMTMLGCEADGSTFALAHADVGQPERVAPALEALQTALRSKQQGTPEVLPWSPAGATGARRWRLQGRVQDGRTLQVESAVWAHGTRVFQLVALGPRLSAEAGETFIDSLQAVAP